MSLYDYFDQKKPLIAPDTCMRLSPSDFENLVSTITTLVMEELKKKETEKSDTQVSVVVANAVKTALMSPAKSTESTTNLDTNHANKKSKKSLENWVGCRLR